MNKLQNLTKGIIKENPVLVLVLGTCPSLAISTQATNALGMGIAATLVLLGSNVAISALRNSLTGSRWVDAAPVVAAAIRANWVIGFLR